MQHTGFRDVLEFLERRGLDHAVVEHHQTFTAGAEARVAAVPPAHAAKTVMLRDDAGYLMVVVPASALVDLRKARKLTGRHALRLATERELAADFPAFEVGALPPFGELFDCPELIDARLFDAPRVLCNAGDHRHSVVIHAQELWYASGAQTADIVNEHAERVSAPAAR
jgi:Ala-tRNA(Pro) deacylase